MTRWIAWKQAVERVERLVVSEIAEETGLSSADFSVLTRVVEDGAGRTRQQRLADDLGWERSRLSRQLSRMQERGYVVRETVGVERWVSATSDGRELVARARPAHARAVRRHLLEAVPGHDRDRFWAVVEALGRR